MEEIKLVKKYPNIRDEDVTEIFQEGYLKGFENGRKNAITIEWLHRIMKQEFMCATNSNGIIHFVSGAIARQVISNVIELWEKENEKDI